MADRLGFIGLGDMGKPMASCLAKAGMRPLLWARNPANAEAILPLGANLAPDVAGVFADCSVVILMLAHGAAIDEVLGRGTRGFDDLVRDRTVVHMGTTPPAYSRGLGADITDRGGRYIEMPVSGSSDPAAQGALVAMASGHPDHIDAVEPLVAPMVSAVIRCGEVPKATQMKLAVNTYLGGLVLGLMESVNFARACALDLGTLRGVLEAGPMSNDLMRMKLPKLIDEDYAPQGSVRQGINNMTMIADAGTDAGVTMPVSVLMRDLFTAASEMGFHDEDMIAIAKVLATRGPVATSNF
ncbi:MAG: NAD(P)-dependent oxidoreductase [Pseudomonadota bacterium]